MEKLTIFKCDVDTSGKATATSTSFKVMLNPEGYSHKHSISYDQTSAMGKSSPELKYKQTNAEEVTFKKLIVDGTGVVDAKETDVAELIEDLKAVIYAYDGEKHAPNVVKLEWGQGLSFTGRLSSMSIDYTLFKPTGEPLRAELALSFKSYMSNEEEALRSNRSSPDLTHIIEVKAGDTLPLLCYRVYNDCSYYPDVARINSLSSFQDIKPGSKLRFPPLK